MGRPVRDKETNVFQNIQDTEDARISLADTSHLKELPLDTITVRDTQQRGKKDANDTSDIDETIKDEGIIQPIVVHKKGDKYELIAGERRYNSAVKNGLSTIPVVIKIIKNEAHFQKVQFIENNKRRALSLFDEIKLVKTLTSGAGNPNEAMDQKTIQSEFNVPRQWVNDRYAVSKADDEFIELAHHTGDIRKIRELITLNTFDAGLATVYCNRIKNEEDVSRSSITSENKRLKTLLDNKKNSSNIEEQTFTQNAAQHPTSVQETDQTTLAQKEVINEPQQNLVSPVNTNFDSDNHTVVGEEEELISNEEPHSNHTPKTEVAELRDNRIKASFEKMQGKLIDLKVNTEMGNGTVTLPTSLSERAGFIFVDLDTGGTEEMQWLNVHVIHSKLRE